MTNYIKRLLAALAVPLCFLACMIIVDACSSKQSKPKDLLDKEEMVKVLSELYLAEQKISSMGVKRDSLKLIFAVMKDRIFVDAGTTDSVFKRSLNHYMDQPQAIEGIYTALIDSLNLAEQRMISNEVKK